MNGRQKSEGILGGIALVVLLLASIWVRHHASAITSFLMIVGIILGAISVLAAAVAIAAFRSTRVLYILVALRAWKRWRWMTRNIGLAKADTHRSGKDPSSRRIRHLRVRIRPSKHGINARVRTIPGTGRAEFEASIEHIRNDWRCARVQVIQEAPGRLLLRGLRTDPLALPMAMSGAPAGTYERPDLSRLYLGKDSVGDHRYLPLSRQTTGVTIAGLPGMGKSCLTSSFLCQTAGTPAVQYAIADGKGGGDWHDWRDRAWLYSDDDLGDALALLEDVHAEMRRRLGVVVQYTGHRNAWAAGPSEEWPLLIWILDECQSWLDIAAMKGDQTREAMARRCVRLAAEVIRKSGAVMMLGVIITQKPTSDSLPTSIRDNCALGVSFGLKTTDACVAALGESIRTYPGYSPLQLRDPSMTGVCSSTLPTGTDPYCLLRVPEVTEEMSALRAVETAAFRRDPAQLAAPVPVHVPA